MARLPSIDWSDVPTDFKVGVVFGPSGSGKTTLAHMLAAHASPGSVGRATEESFQKDAAVVSHPGFNADAISRLSAVGLNKIPSWCRPYHVLSNGEQSRVRTALSLCRRAVLDDFAQVVDEANANSMAASLVKLARSKGYDKIVISTTKSCVLPFLQPDFVMLTKSGKMVRNPYPEDHRAPKLLWHEKISGYSSGVGWQSDAADVDDGSSGETFAGGESLPNVLWDKSLEVYVKMDGAVGDACRAFDYEFTGLSTTNIKCVNSDRLQQYVPDFKLAAILGPSGSGKSHCLNNVGAEIEDNFEWDQTKSVISQLTKQEPRVAAELCAAVALPLQTALRPFHVLSQGEQHCATIARRLDAALDASASSAVGLDEFTSVLDRRMAKTVCLGINQFVRDHPSCRPIIVATVHQDIARNLHAQWVLDTDKGRMLRMPPPRLSVNRGLSFRLSQTEGDEDEMKQLLKPPVLNLTIRKLRDNRRSIEVFNEVFEQHHYMKGRVPSTFAGVVVRQDETNALVAFHAIAPLFGASTGKISMRESRLVVVPEFQGFGLGPKLSDRIGQILIDSGRVFYSVTHHPRLGGYRDVSKLWKPTLANGKQTTTMTLSGKRTVNAHASYHHMFLGTSEDGNRALALKSCAGAVGLFKRPGKLVMVLSATPRASVLKIIQRLHGKTPKQYLTDVRRTDGEEELAKRRKWLEASLVSGKNIELREVDDDELLQIEEHLKKQLVGAGLIVSDAINDESMQAFFANRETDDGDDHEVEQHLKKQVFGAGITDANCDVACALLEVAGQVETPKKVRKRRRDSALPADAVLARTGKQARSEHIAGRLDKVDGKTVAAACGGLVTFTKTSGKHCIYKRSDAKYDLAQGWLKIVIKPAVEQSSQEELGDC